MALRYLKKLSPLAPESIEAQLAYAEVLNESRKKKGAQRIADRLLGVGETDAVRLAARRILEQEVDLTVPALERKAGATTRVVLVPMGVVEKTLRRRTVKQIIACCGDSIGVPHCSDPECVFCGAPNIRAFDYKGPAPCVRCEEDFADRLRR